MDYHDLYQGMPGQLETSELWLKHFALNSLMDLFKKIFSKV